MDSFQTVLKLAFELHNAGRHAEAEASCRVLLPANPRDSQLLFLLGMILHKTGRNQEAVEWLRQAAEIQPHSPRILSGLGCARLSLGDAAGAVTAFTRSLELDPRSAANCYNLGNACFQLDDIAGATAHFRRAVELDPRDAPSWNNLGKCLKEMNRLEESIAAYEQALAVSPDYHLAQYGRAVSLLTAGRLREGFSGYEFRRFNAAGKEATRPVWNGEALPGGTLLLRAEQGFGDAIQHLRFVALARKRVGRVILECRPELKNLFTLAGCADVVIAYGESIPPHDRQTSLLSLPHFLGIELDSVPNQVPYLKMPPASRLTLPPAGNRIKIGLAWAGNPAHHSDAARSMIFQSLVPLLDVSGAAFYSLQVPMPARDQAPAGGDARLMDLSPSLREFGDTAVAIAGMDLVISVDTAVAHLAGALAKPVWVLMQHSPDWRWLLGRSDTPWYPTMRLFRQPARGDWDSVVKEVTGALAAFVAARP